MFVRWLRVCVLSLAFSSAAACTSMFDSSVALKGGEDVSEGLLYRLPKYYYRLTIVVGPKADTQAQNPENPLKGTLLGALTALEKSADAGAKKFADADQKEKANIVFQLAKSLGAQKEDKTLADRMINGISPLIDALSKGFIVADDAAGRALVRSMSGAVATAELYLKAGAKQNVPGQVANATNANPPAGQPSVATTTYRPFQPSTRPNAQTTTEAKQILKISIPKIDPCQPVEIGLTGPHVFADNSTTFVLSQSMNPLRSEEVGMVISPKGLLQSTDTLSSGELDQIIKILAQVAISAATGIPVLTEEEQTQTEVTPDKEKQKLQLADSCMPMQQVSIDFDPTNPGPALNELHSRGFAGKEQRLILTAGELSNAAEVVPGVISSTAAANTPAPKPHDGVFYRSLQTYNFSLSFVANGVNIVQHVKLDAPGGPVAALPVPGALFADEVATAIRFNEGIPVSYDRKSPSEALAAAGIPLDIVNAVMRVPLDALTFDILKTKKETDLTDAQIKLLDKVLELRKKQEGEDETSEGEASEETQ